MRIEHSNVHPYFSPDNPPGKNKDDKFDPYNFDDPNYWEKLQQAPIHQNRARMRDGKRGKKDPDSASRPGIKPIGKSTRSKS